jgi:hypothetical protein
VLGKVNAQMETLRKENVELKSTLRSSKNQLGNPFSIPVVRKAIQTQQEQLKSIDLLRRSAADEFANASANIEEDIRATKQAIAKLTAAYDAKVALFVARLFCGADASLGR